MTEAYNIGLLIGKGFRLIIFMYLGYLFSKWIIKKFKERKLKIKLSKKT